jgi:ubiquitin C-terminal hydrolase
MIDEYHCIKCSLRDYMSKFTDDLEVKEPEWNTDSSGDEEADMIGALNFFLKIYRTADVDEEEFVKKFKAFKLATNNRSVHYFAKKKVQISKSKQLLRPPKTLVFHLNRLSYDNTGNITLNHNLVKFPEHLELDSEELCPYTIDLKYKLCGVIEHMGTPRYGHYIAAKRIARPIKALESKRETPATWLVCNDSIIQPIQLEQVLQSKAYMLFYERE